MSHTPEHVDAFKDDLDGRHAGLALTLGESPPCRITICEWDPGRVGIGLQSLQYVIN
jgi:hypothetical protein